MCMYCNRFVISNDASREFPGNFRIFIPGNGFSIPGNFRERFSSILCQNHKKLCLKNNDFYVKNPPDDILENRLKWC